MPKKITFNDTIQNKVKDFVSSKRWSNSQFASKYSDSFAKIYSKMEAPSTSTSRKLIEEKGHEYSEKECIVLEKLTAIAFHKLWLEEQKRVILMKMDDYSLTHGEKVTNHGKSFDTETQLNELVKKYTRFANGLSVDDLTVSISRYVNIETKMPLVIFCDTAAFASYLIEECVDNPLYVEADKLLEDGGDYPNNIIYTSLKVSPMSKEAGKCVNDALKVIHVASAIGKAKHVIVIIESWDNEAIAKALTEWRESALLLQFHWTYQLMHGWVRMEENAGRMHSILKKYILDRITEIKTYKDPNGNSHYKPSFEYLYNIHIITCMNLDKGEEPLLMELMKDDVNTFGINTYLISRIFNTDDFEEMGRIHHDLEKKVASQRPTVPETTQKHINRCLSMVKTWPEVFKDEVRNWVAQGGSPIMPDCDGADEWMEFLMNLYEKQQEWLDDENYLAALNTLKADGFPMHWFSDKCDQKSLLTAMITYPEWKATFPHKENFDLPQLQLILLSGKTPSLDVAGWKRWFERTYNLNLVAFNFDLMIQIHQLKLKLGRVS